MKKITLTMAQTAAMMAILTLGSKIVGFARELVMANYYGAGMVTDAYVMSQTIPNYLLSAIISAVGTSYMPCFSRKQELEGPESGNRFTSQLINFQLVLVVSIIIIGEIFASPLVNIFARGFSPEAKELTVYYLRIAFLIAICNIFISVLGSYMQYKGRFVAPLVISFAQSASIIVFTVISAYTTNYVLIYGLVVGYGIRAIFYVFLSKGSGFRYSANFEFGPLVKEVTVLAIPVFLGGCVSQVNSMIDRMLASDLAEGSVSALNYGNLVVGVISSLSIGILTTMLYPKFNQAVARDEYEKVSTLACEAVNLIAVIAVPFTLGCMLYSEDVIQILFERGAFTAAATGLTAEAFRYYALTLLFSGIASLIGFIYYSLKDTKTAVYCSLVAIAVNITLNIILVKSMGVAGLALATGVSSIVNCTLMYVSFRKQNSEIRLISSVKKLVLILLFSAAAVGISYLFYIYIAPAISIARMVRLGLAVLLAVGVYLIFLYIARFEELKLIKDLIGHGKQN